MIKRIIAAMAVAIIAAVVVSCSIEPLDVTPDVKTRLKASSTGIWISGGGTYTVYTDDHYVVVSFEGDTASPSIYVGVSQVVYHEKGMARKQNIRLRQFPGGSMTLSRENVFLDGHSERPMVIDTSLFTPGTCNIKDGVIYDAVTEVTEEYIILATCNGDQIKLFDDGRSAYLPAGGGEYFSYRVEEF